MATIVGISGSLRKGSYNTMLLREAVRLAPEGSRVDVGEIRGLPVFDEDLENEAFPASVAALKEKIAAADGVLLVTPEYNNSIPGSLKNAIDWLTRPSSDVPRVFHKRAVALMGATNGQGGTALAQAAWLPVLRTLQMRFWAGPKLAVNSAKTAFGADGRLLDEATEKRLRSFMAGFVEFIEERKR